jgi:HD-like signal output (HDOD) protein
MSGILQRLKNALFGSNQPEPSSTQGAKVSPVEGTMPDVPLQLPIKLDNAFYETVFQTTILDKGLSVPESLVVHVVEANLKNKDKRNKSVPRLPTVVPQLMRSLRDPKSSATQYVNIIKQDPVIAAALLKMANSAYFNPHNKHIDSFQRAVVTLGTDGLRSILSTAVMQPIIQCKSEYFAHFGQKLWDHSLCTAVCCQILASKDNLDPFKAYLLGLVHDIGPITIFTQLANEFRHNGNQESPPAHAFYKLIDESGKELSHLITKEWELPEEIHVAIKEQIKADESSRLSQYGTIIFRANQICEAYVLMKNGLLPPHQAETLLAHWRLPEDLYQTLDRLLEELTKAEVKASVK